MSSLVVGTAGHIDHGKTSLVRLLTGAELDTLPEEKERGITIALGFTALELPDGRRVALVDVPGHERLVRTMIAGATGLDAVILVVSAVDGAMPQTREHLAILGLLGVTQGLVVLTMADLVDEELLELAVADVEDLIEGSFLEGAPILPTSALTRQGREDVLAALATLTPAERADDGPFRLPIDRAFTRTGFGTVVTGTSWSGVLEDGVVATLLPKGEEVRIRGMEVHGEKATAAGPGLRVALNLARVEKAEVPRGTVVVKGSVPCPHMLDVRYTHLPDAEPLNDGASVRVLLGTAEAIGRLNIAADRESFLPGARVSAQLRLDTPLPCLPGDRFVLRRTSPLETLGGGVVVDPWTRRMRKKGRTTWGRDIARLHDGDKLVWLERAGDTGLGEAEWAERATGGVLLGDRVLAPAIVARLQGALVEGLASFHIEQPLALGAQRRELRRGRLGHLSDRVFDALVDSLDGTSVQLDGPLVRAKGFAVQLDPSTQALREAVLASIVATGLDGLKPKDLHAAHTDPAVAALLRLIEDSGDAMQVASLGWVASGPVDALLEKVRAWFTEHPQLTPGEFKELSGLTRRAAIPLLEWLDKQRFTAFGPEGRRSQGSQL